MIRILLPPAARRRLTILPRFVPTVFILVCVQVIGSGNGMHGVMSLPLIEIVTRPTVPLCLSRKSTAAAVCVLPPYPDAPGARSLGSQPARVSIELVVAPAQPRLTSLKR